MRIRKRQVPLPFSSISPVPLSSDPNFNQSPVVQLPLQQHLPLPTPCFDPQYPSDHPNHPIGQRLLTQGDSSAFPGTTTLLHGEELRKKQNYLAVKQRGGGGEERGGEGEKSNDTRKKTVLGAELGIGSLPQSSSSQQAVGRWGEGEKRFPLKKRRGSFERRRNDDDDEIMAEKDNKKVMINTNKMKTKMNKKQKENEHEEDGKDSASTTVDNNNISSAKKRGRGGTLMEGSRCSRVNGRGWRCCQQTLVGYSLCEHHLGKGRLRSMTSVRSRSLASSNNAAKEEKSNNDHKHQTLSNYYSSPAQEAKQTKREMLGENGDEEGEDQKPLMMAKKRVKLGMVKARSISSLLGQSDNAIEVADHNN